jgi:uncharacterized protein HemX
MGFGIALVSAAVLSAGASVYSGERQRKIQAKQLRQQKRANEEQVAQATSAQKLAAQAMARANKRQPNIGSILSAAQGKATQGPASTMLSSGRNTNGSLLLGRSSLLGGGA